MNITINPADAGLHTIPICYRFVFFHQPGVSFRPCG